MKQMICGVGKNSRQAVRKATEGSRAPKQQQQEAEKCEKSCKGSWGGNNGGSPQRKQVGPKPACPSFQPSTAEIRAAGRPDRASPLPPNAENSPVCQIKESKEVTSWRRTLWYISFTWLQVKSHAAMISVSTPCHFNLFLSSCADPASNWRRVRFKPMLLMGKNVWNVWSPLSPHLSIFVGCMQLLCLSTVCMRRLISSF